MNISYAVLSDIHSNHHALETCVRYVLDRGITKFLFLGDYVGELAYPQKTLEIIYELASKYDCTFIRGNREEYMLKHQEQDDGTWIKGNSISGAALLRDGLKNPGDVLNRAMELCKEREIEVKWPFIPEAIWEQAMKEVLKL